MTVTPASDLPSEVDVLIIGAGPAGTAAATTLARAGASVVLADQAAFPREKVCGDALVPDALAALRRLNLLAPVQAAMKRMRGLRVYVPDGSFVSLDAELGCVQRSELDAILLEASVAAGASALVPARVVSPLSDGPLVVGAAFECRGQRVDVRARTTILATGAAAKPLQLFGLCTRSEATATAARRYYQVPEAIAASFDHLCISYDRSICPGYGWLFPGPSGVFNVGVGYFYDSPRLPDERNLRVLFERFLSTFEPARALVSAGTPLSPLRGAPLRTGLSGTQLAAPGVLVVGEAAGLTYPFSGEGIGKALESGMLAAEVILSTTADAATIARTYGIRVREAYQRRYQAYKLVQDLLARPWVANFVARRARAKPRLHRALEGVLTERLDPSAVFSVSGVLKCLLP